MNYTPKTEMELEKESLLPEGTYDFEVIETSDRPSKKGNDMITLKLNIFGGDGSNRHIYDYIALGSNFGERKLRKAAAGCGLMDIYNSGALKDQDFLGANGKAFVRQEDGTVEFPAKNIVGEYWPHEDAQAKPTKPTTEIINDDIPF